MTQGSPVTEVLLDDLDRLLKGGHLVEEGQLGHGMLGNDLLGIESPLSSLSLWMFGLIISVDAPQSSILGFGCGGGPIQHHAGVARLRNGDGSDTLVREADIDRPGIVESLDVNVI